MDGRKIVTMTKGDTRKEGEIYHRLNYLLQAAKWADKVQPLLSAHYLREFVEVAEKRVIRIHRNIKRRFCRQCRIFYRKRVVVKRKKTKAIYGKCQFCRRMRFIGNIL